MTPIILKLKAIREAAALTQQELAEAVGVRQATISDLETGKAATLRLSLLEALADALGVNASELIDHTPRTAKPKRGRGR